MELYRSALDAAEEPAEVAESLRRQAHVHRVRCEWDAAIESARRSIAVAEPLGADLLAESLNAEAAVHQSRGDFELAIPLYERLLGVARDERIRGVARQNLGGIRAMQGALEEAERHLRAAHASFVIAEYPWGRAHVLNNLGRLAIDRGDWAVAEETLAEAVAQAKIVDDHELLAIARMNHAEALVGLGELERAETAASAAVGHLTLAGNQLRRVEALRLLGDIHVRKGDSRVATRLYTSALETAEEIGAKFELAQLRSRLEELGEDGAGA